MPHRFQGPKRGRRRTWRIAIAIAAAAAITLAAPTLAHANTGNDPEQPPGQFSSENIAQNRTAENFFYRIPALTHLGDGIVLSAWDARPGSAADAPNPNSIMQRRSTDNGRTWGAQEIVAAGQTTAPRFGYSDPSYVTDRETGRVFMFFVYSKDQGFQGSAWGDDDADRQVISSAVMHSDDGGVSWSEPRLITDVTKPANGTGTGAAYVPVAGDVRANFATSGEGIQLRYGPHAGRLLQQYAGTVQQANGTTAIQAYSVYSDDHGDTWQRGEFVGTGMDENKVVELSDGTVMMNSRDSSNGRFRKVTVSTDGGVTWGPVAQDLELPDPTNNASIIRLHPEAPEGSAEARKLLFVNANNGANGSRVNGAARLSCDDGETWPGLRTLEPGFFAYASASVLDAGRIGVLWERNYTDNMQFSSFDEAWLNALCAPLSAPSVQLAPGASGTVPVTVTNQEDAALSGSVSLQVPSGWSATPASLSALAPGASVTLEIAVTAASDANGLQRVQAVLEAGDGRVSQATIVLGAPKVGATLSVTNTSPARDVVAQPYEPGDVLSFRVRVQSTTDAVANVVPGEANFTSGFAPTACRWQQLPANDAYNCVTPRITLTNEDIARGWVAPEFAFTVTPVDDASQGVVEEHRGAAVLLRDGVIDARIDGARDDGGRDLAAEPYVVGEQLPYGFSVESASPVATTVAPTAGSFAPFVPPGAGNCRYQNLPAFGSYQCATPRHTVTTADIEQGYFEADTTWTVSAAGQTTRTLEVAGGEVDVIARDPQLSVTAFGTWDDADGDGVAEPGESVRWALTAANTGNVRLDAVRVGDDELDPLAIDAEAAAGRVAVRLTEADVAAGSIAPPQVVASASNGSRAVEGLVVGEAVALPQAPAWSAETVYRAGAEVTHDGSLWVASWWTRGKAPGDPRGPWQEYVTDAEGTAVWTPSRIFTEGDPVTHDGAEYVAKWWTRDQAPGDPRGPWQLVQP